MCNCVSDQVHSECEQGLIQGGWNEIIHVFIIHRPLFSRAVGRTLLGWAALGLQERGALSHPDENSAVNGFQVFTQHLSRGLSKEWGGGADRPFVPLMCYDNVPWICRMAEGIRASTIPLRHAFFPFFFFFFIFLHGMFRGLRVTCSQPGH